MTRRTQMDEKVRRIFTTDTGLNQKIDRDGRILLHQKITLAVEQLGGSKPNIDGDKDEWVDEKSFETVCELLNRFITKSNDLSMHVRGGPPFLSERSLKDQIKGLYNFQCHCEQALDYILDDKANGIESRIILNDPGADSDTRR